MIRNALKSSGELKLKEKILTCRYLTWVNMQKLTKA